MSFRNLEVPYYSQRKNQCIWYESIKDWGLPVNQFAILFDGRFPALINPCHLHSFYDRVRLTAKEFLAVAMALVGLLLPFISKIFF